MPPSADKQATALAKQIAPQLARLGGGDLKISTKAKTKISLGTKKRKIRSAFGQ